MDKKNKKHKIEKSNLANLPLKEYYATLPAASRKIPKSPRDEFMAEIMAVTGRSHWAVRQWCLGNIVPPLHVQDKMADHFGTTPETLFPKAV
ncbi:hypothetical protein [Proteiniphilum acetatigenes]|uniref:hypothetical protein n=1 Tax=Proteiniphilum acetatigenes TaxID=294710 RepID=UPI00037679A1|nr:hypothetical protein [Proteiniphilum acetatigenes]SFK98848.1 hypothetical protein SAMN05216357_11032 [Porphyromonadaceae bacterium KH3CP3RA]